MTAPAVTAAPDRPAGARGEMAAMLSLALPLAIAQAGLTLMTTVDVYMVGPLGKGSLAAIALGGSFANTVTMFGLNLLAPLDAFVARALGAKDAARVGRAGRAAVKLALLSAIPLTLLLAFPVPGLRAMLLAHHAADSDAILAEAAAFTRGLSWGVPFLLLYFAARNYVEGHSRVRPNLVLVVVGNVVNVAADWALIWGKGGLPALGSPGAALSTTLVRLTMCVAMLAYAARDPVLRAPVASRSEPALEREELRKLFAIGWPVGLNQGLRATFLLLIAVMMEKLGTDALAGNQVAFSIVQLASMFPFAISFAASIRTAFHLGRKDERAARESLWLGHLLGGGFAVLIGLVYLFFAETIARRYGADPELVRSTAHILRICAPYQVITALGAVGMGGLMGTFDTKFMAKVTLASLYVVALPLSLLLAFVFHLGAVGIWIGPCASGAAMVIAYQIRFDRRVSEICAAPAQTS